MDLEVIEKYPKIKECCREYLRQVQPRNAGGADQRPFESRTTPELGGRRENLPDLNQFVDRSVVNEVLKEGQDLQNGYGSDG
jgi:hypothetical protein